MEKRIRFFIILFLMWINIGKNQEIPNEFYSFKKNKFSGIYENWENISNLGPPRFDIISGYHSVYDSIKIITRFGLINKRISGVDSITNVNNTAYYGFGHLSFKKYFYAYVYARIIYNNSNIFPRYTGKQRYYGRSGEIDISGIGYQNDFIILQWGRGRQDWSAGEDIQLVLSENSPSYDYGLIGFKSKNIRARYLHGYLERVDNYNRFITGRGIEWTNNKSIVLSISEIAIYSGENRHLDIAYLNPIGSHLEVEMNGRQNQDGFSSGNGVWQISADILLPYHFRISGNLLYDEYTIDKDHGMEKGEGDSKAYSIRVELPTPFNDQNYLEKYSRDGENKKTKNKTFNNLKSFFYLDYIMIGTHTLRHMEGYNNFVQRELPLGWYNGSDGEQFRFGFKLLSENLIVDSSLGAYRFGEKNIKNNPYSPYSNFKITTFPSGNIEKTKFVNLDVEWWWRYNLSIGAGLEWRSNENINGNQLYIYINYFLPGKFILSF